MGAVQTCAEIAIGSFCMPRWWMAPITVLVCFFIVILFAYGNNILNWGSNKRNKGGGGGLLIWLICLLLVGIGLFFGWLLVLIAGIIVAATALSWFLRR